MLTNRTRANSPSTGLGRRRSFWNAGFLALVAAGPLVGCDDGLSSPEVVTVTEVAFGSSQVAVEIGATAHLRVVLVDRRGDLVEPAAAGLHCISQRTDVATVVPDATGCAVTGVGAGTTVIWASSGSLSARVIVTVPAVPTEVAVLIENALIAPIAVVIDGTAAGEVGPLERVNFAAPVDIPLQVSWSLLRPIDDQGRPLGHQVSDAFPTVRDPREAGTYMVMARTGDESWFAPVVVNQLDVDLVLGVNMGLASEFRCDCVVPTGGTLALGYHPLVKGANVYGYPVTTGYDGPSIPWQIWPTRVDPISGKVELEAVFSLDIRR